MAEEHPSDTTVTLALGADHAVVQQFGLRVQQGLDEGRTFKSAGARTVIGSEPSVDLALRDPSVSRFHCEILLTDGKALIRDLGSRNGTRIDGVSVSAAFATHGATLEVGETRLRFEYQSQQLQVPVSKSSRFGAMVGNSQAMRAAFAVLERAAATDVTVLIQGETGTGKEAAAESIHRASARAEKPFIVVDCASIPPNLLASELFGHVKGSFTGATSSREGAFEAANGGTVFLDEIGELSTELQPQLLRVLEAREVKPVGRNRHVPIDVRVIAATHRDLRAEVNAHTFRSDLYYRLAVLEVHIPALRHRREDLPLLVENVLASLKPDAERAAALRSPEFLADLQRHAWPGNVRELRNHVERCLALRRRQPLSGGAAEPTARAIDLAVPFKQARETLERRYLEKSLELHKDNVTAAARTAQLDRIQFYRLLWKHGLR
jgi:DNA-binding NtrC family response regulator